MSHKPTHLGAEDLKSIRQCAACGGTNLVPAETIQTPYTLTYFRCRSCNLMFMNPMPKQDWYDRFYADVFWERRAKKNLRKQLEEQLAKEADRAHAILNLIDEATLGEGYVLEVGCAFGLICRSLGERLKLTPVGVEPSIVARKFAARHIQIIGRTAADIADWHPERALQLVIFSNVLENISDPEAALTLLKDKLSGLLVIETPDPIFASATSIYHPYVFSADSLHILLNRLGFQILRHERDKSDPQAQRIVARLGNNQNLIHFQKKTAFFPIKRATGRRFIGFQKEFRKLIRNKKKRHRLIDDIDKNLINNILKNEEIY